MIGEAQTRQRTDSVMHIIVRELLLDTTLPSQRTNSMKHRLVSKLLHWITDSSVKYSMKHRLVRKLIWCTTQPHHRTNSILHTTSSGNWFTEAQLVTQLIWWSTDSPMNYFPRPYNLVRELIRSTTDFVIELIRWSTDASANSFDAPHNLVRDWFVKQRLIRELIRWSSDSSANNYA
jgi:hypothetical protein